MCQHRQALSCCLFMRRTSSFIVRIVPETFNIAILRCYTPTFYDTLEIMLMVDGGTHMAHARRPQSTAESS